MVHHSHTRAFSATGAGNVPRKGFPATPFTNHHRTSLEVLAEVRSGLDLDRESVPEAEPDVVRLVGVVG